MEHTSTTYYTRSFRCTGKVLALFVITFLFVVLSPVTAFADGTINTYEELEQACQDGGVYTLEKDIIFDEAKGKDAYPQIDGKTITINLNGHTINANGALYALSVHKGSLTIQDSSAQGNGKVTGGADAGILVMQATFTLLGGQITDNEYGIRGNGDTVFISGGSVSNNAHYGIEIFNKGKLLLQGAPTITNNKDADIIMWANEGQENDPISIWNTFKKPAVPITIMVRYMSMPREGIFTVGFKTNCTGEPSEYFESHDQFLSVVWDEDEAALIYNYEITFVDDDNTTVLKGPDRYLKGTKTEDIVKPADPSKADDVQYTYTFAGWTPEIVDVSGEATYTATYTATTRKYKITFVDEDGTTVLKEPTEYEYGTKAVDIVKPADPSKADDVQYTYAFAGWTPEIVDVSGEATYTATYTATIRKYKVTFDTSGGSDVEAQVIESGKTVIKPADPVKEGFIFGGWYLDSGLTTAFDLSSPITADMIIYSKWNKEEKPVEITYTVVSGSNSTWIKDSNETVTITVKRSESDDTCFSHFAGVEIDGTTLSASDFEAMSGSTIITISAETLEKLSIGEHTILVKFDDGEAEIKLTIKAKPAENNTPSKGTNTGDSNHPVLWISLMSLALIGIGAIVLFRKKRMN